MRKHLTGAMLALGLGVIPVLAQATPATTLYVFGDSLVDAGNIAAATGGVTPPAALGYYQGRFSNGPTWADQLNRRLGGGDLRPSLLGGTDYGYGGARARDNGDGVPDLALQVGSYLANSGGAADANGLYLITIGGNDLFDLLSGTITTAQFQSQSLGTVASQIANLAGAGATRFVLTGLPDVTLTPSSQSVPAPIRAIIQAQIGQLNAGFSAALATLGGQLGVDIEVLNLAGLFNDVQARPGYYGLPSGLLSAACIANVPPSPAPDCTPYYYFDTIHPEARVHAIAGQALAELVGVAEPASLLLFGGALIAAAGVYRRRGGLAAA